MQKHSLGVAALGVLLLGSTPAEARRGHGHAHGHSKATTEITVDNPRSEDIHVTIDGRYRGEVDGDEAERFGVALGRHQLLLRAEDGEVLLSTELSVTGERGVRVAAPMALGQLSVDNRSGTTLSLEIDGVLSGTLRSGERRTLELEEGRHQVRAIYTQLGASRVLESERLSIEEDRTSRFLLEPATLTQARVHNTGDRALELVLNGRSAGTAVPGEGVKVEVPVGRNRFELRHEGRVVASLVSQLSPYEDHILRLDPVLSGALTVTNPLPIPVELVCSRGSRTRVPAYGAATYEDLDPGRFALRAVRLTGEAIGAFSARIDPGERERAVVPQPTEGIVVLRSESPEQLSAFVDGRFVGSLAPGGVARLSLPLDSRVLEVRDAHGHEVYERRLRMDPYDEQRLSVDTPPRRPHRHDHQLSSTGSCSGQEHDRDEPDRHASVHVAWRYDG